VDWDDLGSLSATIELRTPNSQAECSRLINKAAERSKARRDAERSTWSTFEFPVSNAAMLLQYAFITGKHLVNYKVVTCVLHAVSDQEVCLHRHAMGQPLSSIDARSDALHCARDVEAHLRRHKEPDWDETTDPHGQVRNGLPTGYM